MPNPARVVRSKRLFAATGLDGTARLSESASAFDVLRVVTVRVAGVPEWNCAEPGAQTAPVAVVTVKGTTTVTSAPLETDAAFVAFAWAVFVIGTPLPAQFGDRAGGTVTVTRIDGPSPDARPVPPSSSGRVKVTVSVCAFAPVQV